MRREQLYLAEMIEAADAIASFLQNRTLAEFEAKDMLRSAVLQKLTIIGEAAARIPESLRSKYPEVEWNEAVRFRNVAVHTYIAVRWATVWETAINDIPRLQEQIGKVLASEFPKA